MEERSAAARRLLPTLGTIGRSTVLAAAAMFVDAATAQQPEADRQREAAVQSFSPAQLVGRLGLDSYILRTHAHEELQKAVNAMQRSEWEPLLAEALASAEPEIRLRAADIRMRRIERELFEPSRVAFDSIEHPVSAVIADLQKQTGNPIVFGDQYGMPKEGIVQLPSHSGDFWPMLDAVCSGSENKFRPHYDVNVPGLVLAAGCPGKYPTAYSGPVRAQIMSARRSFSEDIDFEHGRSDRSHTLQVNVQMMWEPSTRVIAYRSQPEVAFARSSSGKEVRPTAFGVGSWNIAGPTTRQLSMNIRLQPTSMQDDEIDRMRLTWGLIIAGDYASIDMTDLTPGKTYAQDDVECKIESIEAKPGNRFECQIVSERDCVIDELPEAYFQEVDVHAFDAHEAPMRLQAQSSGHAADGARMKLTFVADGPGDAKLASLRFSYPRVRAMRDADLEFRDVKNPSWRPD